MDGSGGFGRSPRPLGAGLLTGLPILLFAVATPLATRMFGSWGPEATVFACLAGELAGA